MLGLTDTAAAINQLPDIGRPNNAKATGTMNASADAQQIPQQSQHENMPNGASRCKESSTLNTGNDGASSSVSTGQYDSKRNPARICNDDVRVAQLDRASASGAEGCRFEPCRG